jgi:hypothetical protein
MVWNIGEMKLTEANQTIWRETFTIATLYTKNITSPHVLHITSPHVLYITSPHMLYITSPTQYSRVVSAGCIITM